MNRSVMSKLALLSWLCAGVPRFIPIFFHYKILVAIFATAGHRTATSLAIGPLIKVPFGSPSFGSFKTIAALSSNFTFVPFGLSNSFFCLTITASTSLCTMSGFPEITVAFILSETPAAINFLVRPLKPLTEIILIILAPPLSAPTTLAPIGNDLLTCAFTSFILNLLYFLSFLLQQMKQFLQFACIRLFLLYLQLLHLFLEDYEREPVSVSFRNAHIFE